MYCAVDVDVHVQTFNLDFGKWVGFHICKILGFYHWSPLTKILSKEAFEDDQKVLLQKRLWT